jgi:hypothetical protein
MHLPVLQLVTTPQYIKHIPSYKDKHRYAVTVLLVRAHEGPLHNLAHNFMRLGNPHVQDQVIKPYTCCVMTGLADQPA